jgi:hypothetical protein
VQAASVSACEGGPAAPWQPQKTPCVLTRLRGGA